MELNRQNNHSNYNIYSEEGFMKAGKAIAGAAIALSLAVGVIAGDAISKGINHNQKPQKTGMAETTILPYVPKTMDTPATKNPDTSIKVDKSAEYVTISDRALYVDGVQQGTNFMFVNVPLPVEAFDKSNPQKMAESTFNQRVIYRQYESKGITLDKLASKSDVSITYRAINDADADKVNKTTTEWLQKEGGYNNVKSCANLDESELQTGKFVYKNSPSTQESSALCEQTVEMKSQTNPQRTYQCSFTPRRYSEESSNSSIALSCAYIDNPQKKLPYGTYQDILEYGAQSLTGKNVTSDGHILTALPTAKELTTYLDTYPDAAGANRRANCFDENGNVKDLCRAELNRLEALETELRQKYGRQTQ